METYTYYRADDYYNGMGSFLGIFKSKEDAESEIEFKNPVASTIDTNHSQITEFTSTNPEPTMKAWEEGEIVADYYYEA